MTHLESCQHFQTISIEVSSAYSFTMSNRKKDPHFRPSWRPLVGAFSTHFSFHWLCHFSKRFCRSVTRCANIGFHGSIVYMPTNVWQSLVCNLAFFRALANFASSELRDFVDIRPHRPFGPHFEEITVAFLYVPLTNVIYRIGSLAELGCFCSRASPSS